MKNDPVNHPNHYTSQGAIECIEITQHMDFCLGNAFKYVWRYEDKDKPREDLDKSEWYLKRYREIRSAHLRPSAPAVRSSYMREAFDRWENQLTIFGPREDALHDIWTAWWFNGAAGFALARVDMLRDSCQL